MAKRITISLSRPHDEPLQLSGYTTETEGLGVYRSPYGLKLPWSIAHLASGTSIGQYRLRAEAQDAATRVGAIGIDWTAPLQAAQAQALEHWDHVKQALPAVAKNGDLALAVAQTERDAA